ncbi:hypothetical protein BB560_005701 [Smittium megazygosporum]|uniref:HMG box domain-containing protein n=1 Tax=Smittium megazygosporum TaxID=133381 RepID=A0A2T9Z0W7_9FUNG|nr:hypothetical protein BB560_005701 [Smittium megazygosporum]
MDPIKKVSFCSPKEYSNVDGVDYVERYPDHYVVFVPKAISRSEIVDRILHNPLQKSKKHRQKNPNRINNSFFMYRTEKTKQITQENPSINQKLVSQICAGMWKNEPAHVKKAFKERYEQLKLQIKKNKPKQSSSYALSDYIKVEVKKELPPSSVSFSSPKEMPFSSSDSLYIPNSQGPFSTYDISSHPPICNPHPFIVSEQTPLSIRNNVLAKAPRNSYLEDKSSTQIFVPQGLNYIPFNGPDQPSEYGPNFLHSTKPKELCVGFSNPGTANNGPLSTNNTAPGCEIELSDWIMSLGSRGLSGQPEIINLNRCTNLDLCKGCSMENNCVCGINQGGPQIAGLSLTQTSSFKPLQNLPTLSPNIHMQQNVDVYSKITASKKCPTTPQLSASIVNGTESSYDMLSQGLIYNLRNNQGQNIDAIPNGETSNDNNGTLNFLVPSIYDFGYKDYRENSLQPSFPNLGSLNASVLETFEDCDQFHLLDR